MDAFQGCYKDGTNGTQDCRYFAGLQLVLRLLFPFIFFITREAMLSLFSFGVVLGWYITFFFVIVQPYKTAPYNKTDVPLLIALLIMSFSTAFPVSPKYHFFHWLNTVTSIACVFAPLLYLVIWSAVHIKHTIAHRTWCQKHTQETDQLLSHVE